jgi:hypothetical protein
MPEADSSKAAQAGRKRSALIAGLGAAFVASAVTVVMLSSTPSPTTTAATDQPAKICKSAPPLMLAVFSEKGGGTVRFREGDWLSPPITLTNEPQPVVFPRARSQTEEITETIKIEGQATDLMWVYPTTHVRSDPLTVNGVYSVGLTWMPMPCQ